jgi:hypothetical protein
MADNKFTMEHVVIDLPGQKCMVSIVVRDPAGIIVCESVLKTLPGYNMETIFVNMFKLVIKSLKQP